MKAGRFAASLLIISAAALWSGPALSESPSGPDASPDPRSWIVQEAPLDEAVSFSGAEIAGIAREMRPGDTSVLRLLDGGKYNVNIRKVGIIAPNRYRAELHPDTVDVWIVQQGSGTLVTGGEMQEGRHSGGTERHLGVGDLVFIPAGVPHGIKRTEGMSWLNIRFPEHRN